MDAQTASPSVLDDLLPLVKLKKRRNDEDDLALVQLDEDRTALVVEEEEFDKAPRTSIVLDLVLDRCRVCKVATYAHVKQEVTEKTLGPTSREWAGWANVPHLLAHESITGRDLKRYIQQHMARVNVTVHNARGGGGGGRGGINIQ